MDGHVLFFFDLFVWKYDRNTSGRNAFQPAGSPETPGVWCSKEMPGSLLSLLDEDSLLLHSIPHTGDSAQPVVFAGFGKKGDLYDSFIWLWCQELPLPWHQVWVGSTYEGGYFSFSPYVTPKCVSVSTPPWVMWTLLYNIHVIIVGVSNISLCSITLLTILFIILHLVVKTVLC